MDRITGQPFASRSEIIALHGMAATSQPLASQAAVGLLAAGGSAVDAAIGANAVQCLVEPTGCGLGGDLFALVWDPDQRRLAGLNASGRSPAGLSLEEFARLGIERIPAHGPLSVSVPGCVDGWCELHERYGRLPLERVFEPAVRYAREGAPITEVIAWAWQRSAKVLGGQPGFADTFLPAGRAPAKGELFANPDLARTLERIGAEGREAFYAGEVAETIDAFMRSTDGYLRREDLERHRSDWIDPVSTTYRGVELWELPPSGQGIAALQILNILEDYDLSAMGFGSADHLHFLCEAKKLAFEDRARFYADPEFAEVPVEALISKEYAATRRALIDPVRAGRHIEPGNPALARGDTICLSTADDDGQMVSLIQSNYRGMGSGLTPPGLGFCLQDRGELFDLTPGRANTYAPRKRPFHTIIPAFLTRDGRPWVSFGVMGGDTQPQGHAQIVINLVDFGFGLQEAGDAPRMVHSGSSRPTGERASGSGRLLLESGFSQENVRELVRRHHQVAAGVGAFGGYQAVARQRGVYFGASESRKDGQAVGF